MTAKSFVLLGVVMMAVAASGCGARSAQKTVTYAAAIGPASRFAGSEQTPQTAPDFALHDQDGQLVRLSAERGKFVLITFLYTQCPDVCPLIATNLNQALRDLESKRASARVLAVSVDPSGDTRAAVRRYVKTHRLLPEFRYLIGSRAELRLIWSAYHVSAVARKRDLVDHVSYVMLIDPEGKTRLFYDTQVKAKDVVHDLRLLMK
jgi:protein SCO1